MDLGTGIGGDLVAAGADQPVDRQPRLLAGDVPKCNVHGAYRANRRDTGARPQQLVEPLAVERVLAHDDRLQKADQRRPVEARRVRGRAEKSMAFDAVISLNPEQAEIAFAGRPRGVVAVNRRWDAVPRKQRQADIGDLHFRLLGDPRVAASNRHHGRAFKR